MTRIEQQAQKVERLYQKYLQSLEEVKKAAANVKTAEVALSQATDKEHSNRDDYNFALAEYQCLLRQNSN